MKKTRSEIMAETFAAYENPENRGLSPMGQCQYLTEDGKMCAVGRCMINPGNPAYINQYSLNPSGSDAITLTFNEIKNPDGHLKDEYRGHDSEFWCDLQSWHDSGGNFYNGHISQLGWDKIEKLKSKWSE